MTTTPSKKLSKQQKSVAAVATVKSKAKKLFKDLLKKAQERQEASERWETDAEEKISYAKSALMKLEPFFAQLLFRLPTTPCYDIPTMATDGKSLVYNPEFISQTLIRKDVIFVLFHEIAHIFFKHNIRGPIRSVDAKKIFEEYVKNKDRGVKDIFMDAHVGEMQHILKEWNYATDHIINNHIFTNTKIKPSKKLKEGLQCDPKFIDKTSEYVYDKIKTKYDPSKDQSQEIDMGIGGILPFDLGGTTNAEIAAFEKEFENNVREAAMTAKRAGKMPGGLEDIIEDLYTTTTPWQDILRTVFTSINKQDYTFQYPNRRYTMHQVEHGVIMPSLWGEEYVNVGFIMDTSGSVGSKEKSILVSELKSILEDYPIKLFVLYCDTKAYTKNVEILTKEDIQNGKLKLNVKGSGGTDMRPAFDYFRENQDKYEFETVICLTDMYLNTWKLGVEPPFSTFWARLPDADKKVKPPFGTCIDIVLDNTNRR